jgi:hypothetical protein
MVATVRLINSGLLDELPSLKVQVSHFGGGIARYLPRTRFRRLETDWLAGAAAGLEPLHQESVSRCLHCCRALRRVQTAATRLADVGAPRCRGTAPF